MKTYYIQPWGEADLEEWKTLSQYATQWHDDDVTEYRYVLTLD